MSLEHSIPPLRDLPPERLAQRGEHLSTEVGREQRRPYALLAAAAIGVLAIVLATPAFGLQGHLVNLFAAKQRPPELIQRYFRNLDVVPSEAHGVIPSKARVAIEVRVPGDGTRAIWVAPTRSGGFCSTVGCDRNRRKPVDVSLRIAGPTFRNSEPSPNSRHVHVFFEGDTLVRSAARVVVQFEDGSSERIPLVWVSQPIDAGFFIYELPKAHWKIGKRPVSFVAEDARGKELAGNSEATEYFQQSQAVGFAPPATVSSHKLLWIVLAAAGVLLAVVLVTVFLKPGWAKRG